MMRIDVTDPTDSRLDDFMRLTDVALRSLREVERGCYLAESPKVIARALAAGHEPRALLLTEAWLGTVEPLLAEHPGVPVYVADEAMLEAITGFHMHRGAIASMHRPDESSVSELLTRSRRIVILDDLADHTNVGAIFRSVVALGADAVLLTPACADPLYRRAVRVSMGAVFQVPWARIPRWQEAGPMLREHGYTIAGLGFSDDAIDLATFARRDHERVALVFGSEGPGLSRQAIGASEVIVTIPMDHDVDSLNVATAAAVTLWALRDLT